MQPNMLGLEAVSSQQYTDETVAVISGQLYHSIGHMRFHISLPLYSNKWSKNFDKRPQSPHHRGGIFMGENLM